VVKIGSVISDIRKGVCGIFARTWQFFGDKNWHISPNNSATIEVFAILGDGQRTLDEWRDGWKNVLTANNKMQVTKWTVDRQAASLVDQASVAGHCGHAEEFLMAMFDKYKHARSEHNVHKRYFQELPVIIIIIIIFV